jgi:hypothetical protein
MLQADEARRFATASMRVTLCLWHLVAPVCVAVLIMPAD